MLNVGDLILKFMLMAFSGEASGRSLGLDEVMGMGPPAGISGFVIRG